ncbi:MAG: hypothetical protein C6I00_04070 [Nitratiruptor sp.]|nr:hypothetical protein [Nitratiruptor sp.]NPA83961.1 hypothetical protein [Campylobacterota bacterium]
MSAKENLEYIKKELSSEEQFLESLIKAEKFYKRYRKPLLGGLLLLLFLGVGYWGYQLKREHDLKVSNEAYARLLQNPQDAQALQILQEKNPRLYQLYRYQEALKRKDPKLFKELVQVDEPILQDLARYHLAVLKKDQKGLSRYAKGGEALLQEMALLGSGWLLYERGAISQGHQEIELVPTNSPAAPFAALLRHYGVGR